MSKDLLPPNATLQERAISLATARASEVATPLRHIWNPDTCPVDLLPWLAWGLSVDTWDSNWSDTVKRAVVRSAIATHRSKGTAGAVRGALAALGAGNVIVEWWQTAPKGDPHTFKVYIVNVDTSMAMQASMIREIDRTKPLRSHYDVIFGTAATAGINLVGVLRPAVFVRLDGGATYAEVTMDKMLTLSISGVETAITLQVNNTETAITIK